MPPDVNELSTSIDMQLRRRALKVVPGGMKCVRESKFVFILDKYNSSSRDKPKY
jgi:hypothetical protein